MKIKQNSIWMVNIGTKNIVGHEQKGNRPFLVISNDKYNENSQTPIGFFLSTSPKKRQNRYTIDVLMNNLKPENVNITQIRTISSKRFKFYMGTISNEELNKVIELFQKRIL